MNEFVAVTSTNIAKILNCYPKKGAILEGCDADLVVWDPERKKTISSKSQQSSIDYNVFEGQKVKGLPRFTLTRGHVSVTEGEISTQEGHGKFVAREANTPVNRALSRSSAREFRRLAFRPATGQEALANAFRDGHSIKPGKAPRTGRLK